MYTARHRLQQPSFTRLLFVAIPPCHVTTVAHARALNRSIKPAAALTAGLDPIVSIATDVAKLASQQTSFFAMASVQQTMSAATAMAVVLARIAPSDGRVEDKRMIQSLMLL
jgi:hypothetical protein